VAEPDHFEIYRRQATDYDCLVAHEDHEGRILPALESIVPLVGLDVVELGAGTGRLTRLLGPRVRSILALDSSEHMLATAATRLRGAGLANWRTAVADHRALPVGAATADLAIAGWSVGYLGFGEPEGWQSEVDRALSEMRRVLRPGGTVVLLETLGTGCEQAAPPAPLVAYYGHLARRGFAHVSLRSDFRFADRHEADELVRFFFGEEMVARLVERDGAVTLPECTGIWWWRSPARAGSGLRSTSSH
jgi:ubiquinone/menaquinone biosynthesis C-methylase UbiE